MIGQHIYSRCLEGYFSKVKMSADSTTVTISADMFTRKEQAEKIARVCERIGALEDVRPVPSGMTGAYRGVLKVRRLNRQISVVCRSYRLHSEQEESGTFSGGGESRNFTYSSSYLLTGEEKTRFFQQPQYFLNIQDFESYPSVMNRIEESRAQHRNGRIEANPAYSLFNSPCKRMNLEVFKQAGFTEDLFAKYICSILERIAYAPYDGHEHGKVLVILPRQFNPAWKNSGGNAYAEEILAATYKILPVFVRDHLNATTGGADQPDAFVLEGYQLVFMEGGQTKDWKSIDYSVIDLEKQESYVTEGLDTSYGHFLWQNLTEEENRTDFEEKYTELFGREKVEEGDNYPEKLAYALNIWKEENTGFADAAKRERYIKELIQFSDERWTERAQSIVWNALQKEIQEPQYTESLERELLSLVQKNSCPKRLKEAAGTVLLNCVLQGNALEETVQWFGENLQDDAGMVEDKILAVSQGCSEDTAEPWYRKDSLTSLYLKICGNHLEDAEIDEELCREMYQNMIKLLFVGNDISRRRVSELIKVEERKFLSDRNRAMRFWTCLKEKLEEETIVLNSDIIWQLTFFPILFDQFFLETEWKILYKKLVGRFASAQRKEIFYLTQEYFRGWLDSIHSEKKKNRVREAIAQSVLVNFEEGCLYYRPDLDDVRATVQILEEGGLIREAAEILYKKYLAEEQQRLFFNNDLSKEEQWKIILLWLLKNRKDDFLEKLLPGLCAERKGLLSVLHGFEFRNKSELDKIVGVYFALLKLQYENQEQEADNPLQACCGWYRKEIKEIQLILGKQNFVNRFQKLVVQDFSKKNLRYLYGLEKEDIAFMKEMGAASLGEGWKSLDILNEIYTIRNTCVSEEFAVLRDKIIEEKNDSSKHAYLNALGNKRKELALSGETKGNGDDLIFNLVLLEEQMRCEADLQNSCNLKKMARRIFVSGLTERDILYTAIRILQVIGCYDHTEDLGAYSCSEIRNECLNEILESSRVYPELFCDKSILKAYKRLGNGCKNRLNQMGLRNFLKGLPKEWVENYGVLDGKNKKGLFSSFSSFFK